MENRKIIVIDDDPEILNVYKTVLTPPPGNGGSSLDKLTRLLNIENAIPESDFQIEYASQGKKGYELVAGALESSTPYALAFIDIRMPPGWDGLKTASMIREIDENIEIVIVTAYSDHSGRTIAEKIGNPEKLLFLKKPFDPEELTQIARSLTRKWNLSFIEKSHRSYIETVINSMPSTIISVDSQCRIINMNPEAEKDIGHTLDKVKGKIIDKSFPLLHPHVADIEKAIETREPIKKTKTTFQRKDKTLHKDIVIYPLDIHGIRGAVIRIDDITSKVLLEEMVVQSEKMLMVGRFAAGMAHEINTPLAGIIQNLQVVKNRFSSSLPKNIRAAEECSISLEAVENYLEKRMILPMIDLALESGKRASETVKNMLSFSRKSTSSYIPQNLNKILDKAIDIAKTEFKLAGKFDSENIKLIREYQEDMPKVMCESSKIQQVILNLLKNASQAMEKAKDSSPQIILRTSSEGEMARIEVEDNGPGMEENARDKIFEPFFTTKDIGTGTGLGLFISYFIIAESHNGTMAVESEPGEGAKFIIKIPFERP